MTTILPPVRDGDDVPHHLRDPIEAVKAALDGRPTSRDPELRRETTKSAPPSAPPPRRQAAAG
ncbi:MAG: hypothetical protein WB777_09915, partial [Mycobacterium sp.]